MSCEEKFNIEDHKYRPLPDGLYIGNSNIHGDGLISDYIIPARTNLGVSHVLISSKSHPNLVLYEQQDCLIRTPLGGHINHSENPNCFIKSYKDEYFYLITAREVDMGEELTLDYGKSICGVVEQSKTGWNLTLPNIPEEQFTDSTSATYQDLVAYLMKQNTHLLLLIESLNHKNNSLAYKPVVRKNRCK